MGRGKHTKGGARVTHTWDLLATDLRSSAHKATAASTPGQRCAAAPHLGWPLAGQYHGCQPRNGSLEHEHGKGRDDHVAGTHHVKQTTGGPVGTICGTTHARARKLARRQHNGQAWLFPSPPVKGTVIPTPLNQSLPNSPILLPPKPYFVPRDTLCSCEAYGMRPMYMGGKKRGQQGNATR